MRRIAANIAKQPELLDPDGLSDVAGVPGSAERKKVDGA
jgi:hypothetical protein